MGINFTAFINSLGILMYGTLSLFLVMGLMSVCLLGINAAFTKKKK